MQLIAPYKLTLPVLTQVSPVSQSLHAETQGLRPANNAMMETLLTEMAVPHPVPCRFVEME